MDKGWSLLVEIVGIIWQTLCFYYWRLELTVFLYYKSTYMKIYFDYLISCATSYGTNA